MTESKTILVVGGCGYIGSHMVKRLHESGYRIVVLDDLSGGFPDALLAGELIVGNCGDRTILDRLFKDYRFDGVLHFASFINVGESVIDPGKYYQNNLVNTLSLLEGMRDHGVKNLVFSSTAAIYGEPEYVPIDESHTLRPINPYGMSKRMAEAIMHDFDRAYGLRFVALRYFNAAGADPAARIGERHVPETHLIPLALHAVLGKRPPLNVFGRDYDTPDGTCIRDYVHVDDLSDAHLLALEYLWRGGESREFNLGNGEGFSVEQVLDAVETVTGKKVPYVDAPRRSGDPARLVANSQLAKEVLGWKPRYCDLSEIVRHAWAWEQKRP